MSFISTLADPSTVAGMLAAGAAFAAVVTLAAPAMGGSKLGSRLKAVAERREELRRKSRAALEKSRALRPEASGFMNDTVQQLNLQKLINDPTVGEKLMQAGLRGPMPVSIFYFFRFTLPFAFGIGAWVYLSLLGDRIGVAENMRLPLILAASALGFYGPSLYVSNLVQKRRDAIMKSFPDALDMLLICVESGMSIEASLHRVSQEIGAASVELAEELSLTTAELSYLQERRMAYENLARRTNHPGVKAVAMALTQAEKYGTPLGNALRVMAKENRELRISAAEKKAAALPAKLTVPMIVFFLPVLFAVIMGPAMIQITSYMSK
ncbi:MAG: type II secretion system F family protein [Hyphomonadaceae bacterium]